MEISATLYHKVYIDPQNVITQLKEDFLGSHGRWVCKTDDKWVIEQDCYHNSTEVVRELTDEEVKYYVALQTISDFLNDKGLIK